MSQAQPSKQPFNQHKPKHDAQGVEFLSSSYLAKADYSPEALQLTIYFKSGSSMTYWPVQSDTWEAFQQAPSVGSFYAKAIKGKFQSVAITSPLKASSLPRSHNDRRKQ